MIVNVDVAFETRRDERRAPGRPGEKERKVNSWGRFELGDLFEERERERERERGGRRKRFSGKCVPGGRSRDRPLEERQRGIAPRQTSPPHPPLPPRYLYTARSLRVVGFCGPSSARKFPGWNYLCVAIKGLLKRRLQFAVLPFTPCPSSPFPAAFPATADALSMRSVQLDVRRASPRQIASDIGRRFRRGRVLCNRRCLRLRLRLNPFPSLGVRGHRIAGKYVSVSRRRIWSRKHFVAGTFRLNLSSLTLR